MNPPIYIIGAQCTGKTTLINALRDYFSSSCPTLRLLVIPELARGVLQRHNITGDDVQRGHLTAMQLQRVILERQFEAEKSLQTHDLMLSDRSGLDPIAYSYQYGGASYAQALTGTEEWQSLRCSMQQSLVILCEPLTAWLTDDGERLMPKTHQEWLDLHHRFLRLLQETSIDFHLLPSSLIALGERVDFVLRNWRDLRQRLNGHGVGKGSPSNMIG